MMIMFLFFGLSSLCIASVPAATNDTGNNANSSPVIGGADNYSSCNINQSPALTSDEQPATLSAYEQIGSVVNADLLAGSNSNYYNYDDVSMDLAAPECSYPECMFGNNYWPSDVNVDDYDVTLGDVSMDVTVTGETWHLMMTEDTSKPDQTDANNDYGDDDLALTGATKKMAEPTHLVNYTGTADNYLAVLRL